MEPFGSIAYLHLNIGRDLIKLNAPSPMNQGAVVGAVISRVMR